MMTAPTPHPTLVLPTGLGFAAVMMILLLFGVIGLVFLLRKFMRGESKSSGGDWAAPNPDPENASAFMAASMQGVIEKLRAQEKELARLHVIAQERAQESERLTEEVTRNMPTGLLLVNATGAISSTNPAAEEALGIRPLRYRSYKEILGAESDLTRMLTACLKDGQTFHRGEVEHVTPLGEARHLGLTISPIFRPVRNVMRHNAEDGVATPEKKVSGAL